MIQLVQPDYQLLYTGREDVPLKLVRSSKVVGVPIPVLDLYSNRAAKRCPSYAHSKLPKNLEEDARKQCLANRRKVPDERVETEHLGRLPNGRGTASLCVCAEYGGVPLGELAKRTWEFADIFVLYRERSGTVVPLTRWDEDKPNTWVCCNCRQTVAGEGEYFSCPVCEIPYRLVKDLDYYTTGLCWLSDATTCSPVGLELGGPFGLSSLLLPNLTLSQYALDQKGTKQPALRKIKYATRVALPAPLYPFEVYRCMELINTHTICNPVHDTLSLPDWTPIDVEKSIDPHTSCAIYASSILTNSVVDHCTESTVLNLKYIQRSLEVAFTLVRSSLVRATRNSQYLTPDRVLERTAVGYLMDDQPFVMEFVAAHEWLEKAIAAEREWLAETQFECVDFKEVFSSHVAGSHSMSANVLTEFKIASRNAGLNL